MNKIVDDMEIEVRGCSNCPFHYSDDWGLHCTVGGDLSNVLLRLRDEWYPENCPLRNEEVVVKLN